MKKWMFIIFPGAMLAIFLTFFLSHKKVMEDNQAARDATVARQQQEADAKKKADEEKAHVDAVKRSEERAAEEKRKADEKAAKVAAADKEVQAATNKALADGDKSAQESRRLEMELENLRKAKDQLSREAFDAAQQVELAKVARRNAELEEQRTIEMIANRADNSLMARLPAAVVPLLAPPPPTR
jgi:hypothetical protein